MGRERALLAGEPDQQEHPLVAGDEIQELGTEAAAGEAVLPSPEADDPLAASMVAVQGPGPRVVEDDVLGEEARGALPVPATPHVEHASEQLLARMRMRDASRGSIRGDASTGGEEPLSRKDADVLLHRIDLWHRIGGFFAKIATSR